MSIPPAFPDISKNVNNLINRDFYHLSKAALDVKTKAPNGVAFAFKAKTGKDDSISSNIETKFTDKANGLTLTQGWNTANALDTKVELVDTLSPGLKAEVLTSVVPNGSKAAKLNLYFSQPKVNVRAFFDLLKGPTFAGDFTVGHEGYVAGSEVGYDISGGKVTRLAVSTGYIHPTYAVGVNASKNFSVFTASYFHKVSSLVEAGAKATYDVNAGASKPVGVEFAAKYALDPTAFVKGKLADSGLAAVAYSQQLRPGVTLGVGLGFDALRLAEPVHKIGFSLSFAA
ncbi:porin [Saccharomycopsis crataegensis]|uniref:Porin n=1 Tax=Saccharomycopsis crataegensis TaxID=43959 RepID=A0AAV5QEX3_9ASCO|nr:porin [Saccharomycopsis crataegensis]